MIAAAAATAATPTPIAQMETPHSVPQTGAHGSHGPHGCWQGAGAGSQAQGAQLQEEQYP